jgi:hypothetical protein
MKLKKNQNYTKDLGKKIKNQENRTKSKEKKNGEALDG